MDDSRMYVVEGRRSETHDTATLSLTCIDGTVPAFAPGQFISAYFPELGTPEGKSYSISNAPGEGTLEITVKAIGAFSNRLCALAVGDTFIGSLPYGFFFSEETDTALVMLAGGIGVTPFRSIIGQAQKETPTRSLSLFQSARTSNDLVFEKEWRNIPGLSVQYFITRETAPHPRATLRRMEVADVLSACTPERSEFMLCGSIPFVRDMWRGLRAAGISDDRMYTEAFFLTNG